MMKSIRSLFLTILFFSLVSINLNLTAQSCASLHDHSAKKGALLFIPNKNQWNPKVAYKAEIGGINALYLEKDALTWHFHDLSILDKLHHNKPGTDTLTWNNHAYQVKFLGAAPNPQISGRGKQQTYHNYFYGNDEKRWAGKVPVFHGVAYKNLYSGIDMTAYSQEGNFKYDFIVAPGIDPGIIQMAYNGTDGLSIEEGNLLVETSITQVKEQRPYAYQQINGIEIAVDCEYQLANNIISFEFPNGYDSAYPLIIDPVVVAATISGAPSDNWGFTATYDNAGNIYAGGASFGVGYPTTFGSFQMNYGGGSRDIAITKYNPDGSQQIYATYVGGSSTDQPHSMVVDFNGQLCIYGISRSADYPVTSSAFQTNNSGGSDIVVTKLNADGSGLVGSTYLGGFSDDGINQSAPNFHDANRGEIILDAQNNIYVISSTLSINFPVTDNAFQSTTNGDQDVVALKINSDLSALFWSTYLGGSEIDIGLGIRVQDDGQVIVSGMTASQNFPIGTDGFEPTWPGGTASAYVVKLSSDGENIVNSTFFGSSGNDYSYFLDLDEDDNVHIFGQTTGTIEVTPNTYFSNPGSRQFLAGFSSDLSERVYSTVIGTGSAFGYDFVPVAFMVDKCNGIYFSGYGAENDLPTTNDAIEPSSNEYFYLAKLSPNAEALEFGTYYGEANHVDGGTSRFDKSGVVYQAVCSCVPGRVMNTLPNAYSQINSSNCSIGVFKVDFEIETVTASAFIDAPTSGCVPLTIDFNYSGANGVTFEWDFGTNDTSTEENPSYTFTESGSYTVRQIAINPNACNERDTFLLQIDVLDNNSTLLDTIVCDGGTSLFLDASTLNATYQWQDGSSNPTYDAIGPGTFWVDVNIGGCARRDSFVISTFDTSILDLGVDQVVCDENSLVLDATIPDVISYEWNDGSSESSLFVTTSGNYSVTVTGSNGCPITDDLNITFAETPDLELGADTLLCSEEMLTLAPLNATASSWSWQDGSNASNFTVTTEGLYWITVNFSNGCAAADSIYVAYSNIAVLDLGPDQILCDENSLVLDATLPDITSYEWSDGSTNPDLLVTMSGNSSVTVTNSEGCQRTDEISITFAQTPDLTLGADTIVCEGEDLTLIPNTSAPAEWSWQDASAGSTYQVNSEGLYWVMADFSNGCTGADSIYVTYSPSPVVDFSQTNILCYGENNGSITAITPTATTEEYQFNWSNNVTVPDLTNLSIGTYQVSITNDQDCVYETEFMITQPDSLIVLVDHEDVTCFDEEDGAIGISAVTGGVPPYSFSLNEDPFSTMLNFSNLDGGFYTLLTQDANNCTTTTEIEIYEPPQIFISAGADKTIELGDSVRIDGVLFPMVNQLINWTSEEYLDCENCLRPIGKPNNTTTYLITAVDSITGCTYVDTMQIIVEKPRNVYIPNAFSPNADGTNDYFFANGDNSVASISYFKIFDRWGELVYEAHNIDINDPKVGWDGTLKGQSMNPGVFVYIMQIQFVDGVVKMYQGDVSIIK